MSSWISWRGRVEAFASDFYNLKAKRTAEESGDRVAMQNAEHQLAAAGDA